MKLTKHISGMFKELGHFAWENKAWWIIPLVLFMLLLTALLLAGQAAAPFIYTLF